MQVSAIQTRKITPGDSLQAVLDQTIPDLVDESILVLTSKIISVTQGCLVPKNTTDKLSLIQQEADLLLESDYHPYGSYLTIKNGILIPSAGIDESNADECYILYPRNIQQTALWIWQHLKNRHMVQKLGVLITDSHTTIMRRGVTGIALGWCGFSPLYSYIGKPDIYNQPLKVTQINVLDSLAAAAVFVMGEGNEQTPLALIREAPRVTFLDTAPSVEDEQDITISMEEDLYGPLLRGASWRKR